MATTTEKIIAGVLVLLAGVGSVTVNNFLTNDEGSTYTCESKNLESGCINGVKACTDGICTRCYYDPDNGRAYEYCKEGWVKVIKQLEPIIIPSTSGAKQYLCDQTKCVPIG